MTDDPCRAEERGRPSEPQSKRYLIQYDMQINGQLLEYPDGIVLMLEELLSH